jgi:mannose-6-phosphate isomerase-like protein (cupin superfamily)
VSPQWTGSTRSPRSLGMRIEVRDGKRASRRQPSGINDSRWASVNCQALFRVCSKAWPGGGPPPHRDDFEEMFAIREGEIELSFREVKSTARAGHTVNVPANGPHQFTNSSEQPARLRRVAAPEQSVAINHPTA